MGMKHKLPIVLTVIALTFTMIASSTLAQTATVGVSIGQTFDYSYVISWSSTDQSAKVPQTYIELNKTQSIELKILDVSGSKISIEKTKFLKDGTQTKETGSIDVDSGNVQIAFGSLIVAANLNENSKLYPSGGNAVIDSTTTRAYTSGQRETNRLLSESNDPQKYQKIEIFYDKQKGVAVSYYFESQDKSDGNTATTQETLICTNIESWINSPKPSYAPSQSTQPNNSGITTPATNSPTNTGSTMAQNPLQLSTLLPIILVIILVVIIVSVLVFRRKGKRRTLTVDKEFEKYIKK
jgi:hypothetical protein